VSSAAGTVRRTAAVLLGLIALGALAAPWLAQHGYAEQSRDFPSAGPSKQFPLGTDELGRDRFSRLIYGTQVSLLLAPAAALVSTVIALLFGAVAALAGPRCERVVMSATDVLLALPTILILFTVRALMPLNVSPWTSILITCGLLGVLGWPPSARVVRADIRALLNAEFVMQARATGQSTPRILLRHVLPNIRPILTAQFWVLVPVFILSEANLSLLGLGVAEPLPSWGTMLRELEDTTVVLARPWVLAPLVALMVTVLCLYLAMLPGEET
jgi:peptide/nickel transport system permease protein